MPKLYVIAGCNGAGKTTASFTILPEMLRCKEFVDADEIARGLSPFQPEKVAFEAGRIMLNRISELIERKEDNSEHGPEVIAENRIGNLVLYNEEIWNKIKSQYHE